MMKTMRMEDVGHFYRPRFAMPQMTEEEEMGPYYGMNDDELRSYSTQIVPPQDLFGLGQEYKYDVKLVDIGGALLVGSIFGYLAYRLMRRMDPDFPTLAKNSTAIGLGTAGVTAAGFFFFVALPKTRTNA
jgi:hypothetical protein